MKLLVAVNKGLATCSP